MPSLSHTPRAIAACQRAKQASKTVQFTPHSTHTILNPGSERKQPASPPGSSGQEVRSLQVPGNIGFRGLGTRPQHVPSRARRNRAQLQPGPPRSRWGERPLGLIHCGTKAMHYGVCDVPEDAQRGTHSSSVTFLQYLCISLVVSGLG